jgi:hypothetical protein
MLMAQRDEEHRWSIKPDAPSECRDSERGGDDFPTEEYHRIATDLPRWRQPA